MKIKFNRNKLSIIKEDTDKKYYSESLLWHDIKKKLQETGYDVIKRLMWKDGHMTDERNYYIRDRKWNYCIIDNDVYIRDMVNSFNDGLLSLYQIDWDAGVNNLTSCYEICIIDTEV
ncbi:MAG TPA: hypothetical protein ENH82_07980 [bacterium]|nr:hypothetical protein [bacterium]